MRRIKLVVGVCVVMAAILALSAGPAIADDGRHHDNNKKHDNNKRFLIHEDFEIYDDHDDFFDHGFVEEVDLEFETVPRHSALVGECLVTDLDGSGSIDDWEVEITCFVPRNHWW